MNCVYSRPQRFFWYHGVLVAFQTVPIIFCFVYGTQSFLEGETNQGFALFLLSTFLLTIWKNSALKILKNVVVIDFDEQKLRHLHGRLWKTRGPIPLDQVSRLERTSDESLKFVFKAPQAVTIIFPKKGPDSGKVAELVVSANAEGLDKFIQILQQRGVECRRNPDYDYKDPRKITAGFLLGGLCFFAFIFLLAGLAARR